MQNNLQVLHEMCQGYTVLYAEDTPEIQEQMHILLARIFKTVYLANDGAIGLALFEKHAPDIVITDIQMPNKNGLDMAASIKEISPKTPILITTAFNEEKYFLRAIECGVDSFLLKPVDKQKLFDALFKVVSQKAYQAKKEELEHLKKVQEINLIAEQSIQELANIIPFPALFYKDNELVFVNNTASETFETVKLSSIHNETNFVSEFGLTKDKRQKIKFPTPSGLHKIYWVYPNALIIGAQNTFIQAYIFINITVSEYQKLKLDNFALFMHRKVQSQQNITTTIEQSQPSVTNNTFLSQEDESILRKTHHHKISAVEYMEELGDIFFDEIDELKDVGEELVALVEYLLADKKEDTLTKIINALLIYTTAIESLSQFKDLGYALRNVTRFLKELPPSADKRKLAILLGALADDLSQWYRNIFVLQSAINIHYLDSSLLSSCFQMEAAFNEDMADNIGDDLELF
ncbi:MAG: response regulator [Campylobacteraceae bacterium]|nr:response regulator [Campylobacteraceae bacterium]